MLRQSYYSRGRAKTLAQQKVRTPHFRGQTFDCPSVIDAYQLMSVNYRATRTWVSDLLITPTYIDIVTAVRV